MLPDALKSNFEWGLMSILLWTSGMIQVMHTYLHKQRKLECRFGSFEQQRKCWGPRAKSFHEDRRSKRQTSEKGEQTWRVGF